MSPHLVLIAAYSVAIVGLGLWTSRMVRGSSDFFVAGRSLGPGLILSSMLAANIGAGRHRQRRRPRLPRRAERVVVERVGGPGVVRPRLLGGPAALGARQDARLLHHRRLPRAPLRSRRARHRLGAGHVRLPVDPRGAADGRRRHPQRDHRRAALARLAHRRRHHDGVLRRRRPARHRLGEHVAAGRDARRVRGARCRSRSTTPAAWRRSRRPTCRRASPISPTRRGRARAGRSWRSPARRSSSRRG